MELSPSLLLMKDIAPIHAQSEFSALFLHGGPGMDFSYFFPWADTVNWPCHVRFYTQGSSGAVNLDQIVAEAVSASQTLPPSKKVIIGHSYGGCLALELVARHAIPDIAALVLISCPHDTNWLTLFCQNNASLVERVEKQISNLLGDLRYRQETVAYSEAYFQADFVEEGKNILENISYNSTLARVLGEEHLNKIDYSNLIDGLPFPVLSIGGYNDKIITPDYQNNLFGASAYTDFSHITIHPGGHFPWVERPQTVARLILDFISRIFPSTVLR